MNKIYVIGAGPGNPELMTFGAARAIKSSDTVFAAERHAKLAGRHEPLEPIADVCDRIENRLRSGMNASVIVSGDPCLYSLLGMLTRRFGSDRIEVIAGIGSAQAFCARIGKTWQDARIISGHGRDLTVSALGHFARTNEKVLMFCDGKHDGAWAARGLCAEGLDTLRMCVGERISYPDERITWGTASDLADSSFDPLGLVWIENDRPERGMPAPGIDDACFVRGSVPMTKREVRVQIAAALNIRPESVVWDVGAGTGSVSIEAARACPLGRVYAFERNDTACELVRENAKRFHINNLTVVQGEAPDVFGNIPLPTHVFIGGSGVRAEAIIARLAGFDRPIRVAATAVTLESIAAWTDLFTRYTDNANVLQMGFARTANAGKLHIMQALNPVMLFIGDLGGKS